MKNISLNKDGTPRKRRNSKTAMTQTVSLSVEEIQELAKDKSLKLPQETLANFNRLKIKSSMH